MTRDAKVVLVAAYVLAEGRAGVRVSIEAIQGFIAKERLGQMSDAEFEAFRAAAVARIKKERASLGEG